MDNNNIYNNDNTESQGVFTGDIPENGNEYGQMPQNGSPENEYIQSDSVKQNRYEQERQNSGYGQPYGNWQGNPYMQPGGCPQGGYQQELEEPVSLSEWIVSLLLIMFIPCVNIILMFVWAFSNKEKKSKSNFFKASLIIGGIELAVVMVIMFIVVIAMVSMGY